MENHIIPLRTLQYRCTTMKTKHVDYRSMIPLAGIGVALLVTVIMWLAIPATANASSDKTISPDTVIASWPVTANPIKTADQAMDVLMSSRRLNASALTIGQVKHYLDEQASRGELDSAHKLVKARLLQLRHDFDEASTLLQDVITSPSHSANAQLLLANIQTQMGQFSQARDTCSELFGKVALIVTFTCTMDADFQSSPSRATYSRLASLTSTRASAPQAQMDWINETLASMALQVGEPRLARGHLQNIELSTAPVSLVALWMDTHIAQDNPEAVLTGIEPLIDNTNSVDDAILLRLAIAEAQTSNGKMWQQKMQQRVKVREWRGDSEHAAQLARYYLDVVTDKDKAIQFASLHYEHSKTAKDAALLARATADSDK